MIRVYLALSLSCFFAGCNLGHEKDSTISSNSSQSTGCADLTTQADCTTADKIPGKTCLWMAKACVEKSPALTDFMSADRVLQATIDGALGVGHNQTPDWGLLCGQPSDRISNMDDSLDSMGLEFSANSDKVKLTLNCTGKPAKPYVLAYRAQKTDADNLLLTLDANGIDVQGQWLMFAGTKNVNLLDFFTKADWLYEKAANKVTGISQFLKSNPGSSTVTPATLTNQDQFEKAITYIKGPGLKGEIASGVESICFEFVL